MDVFNQVEEKSLGAGLMGFAQVMLVVVMMMMVMTLMLKAVVLPPLLPPNHLPPPKRPTHPALPFSLQDMKKGLSQAITAADDGGKQKAQDMLQVCSWFVGFKVSVAWFVF